MPGVLCVHHHGSIVVHHLDVDAVGSDVGEFDIEGGGGGRSIVVGPHGGEGFPSLGGGGRGAHSRVVPFLAVGPRPIDVDHARPYLLGVGVVGVGIERDGVLHLRLGSLASHLDLWCSVFDGYVEDHHGFIPFLVFDRDFDGIDAVVNPGVVEHAGWRGDALVVPGACAVVKRNPELAGHLAAVLVKTPAGVDVDGVAGQAGRLWCHRGRQASHEQLDSAEVVLHICIRRIEATHIGFPQQFNRADGGVFWHFPKGEHFVCLVGGKRRKLVGGNIAIGQRQPCIAGHGGGDASVFDGHFNVQGVAWENIKPGNGVELRGRANIAYAACSKHVHGVNLCKNIQADEVLVEGYRGGTDSISCFGYKPVAGIIKHRG